VDHADAVDDGTGTFAAIPGDAATTGWDAATGTDPLTTTSVTG